MPAPVLVLDYREAQRKRARDTLAGTTVRERYEAATKRDTWWHCEYCGDHEPAEAPYVLGDSEPCSTCGEGVSRVMTIRDGARIESEVARGIRQRRSAYT